jgi:hypothetical protein
VLKKLKAYKHGAAANLFKIKTENVQTTDGLLWHKCCATLSGPWKQKFNSFGGVSGITTYIRLKYTKP